jgi:hypothetical protein
LACYSVQRTAHRPKPRQAQLCKWNNRGAFLLAIAIAAGMLWQVFLVASANRPPRQDADGSPVYERMDAIIRK